MDAKLWCYFYIAKLFLIFCVIFGCFMLSGRLLLVTHKSYKKVG